MEKETKTSLEYFCKYIHFNNFIRMAVYVKSFFHLFTLLEETNAGGM